MTSNSWEYSGDGQALAYEAGAELIDMEFVQFHPTGMVWPPGVRGLLVTEAVRGEGGILRNKDGERFMWKYLPEERRAEYAATDEEASRWVTALSEGRETDARRPPELSTRDNVARAIYTEVREGRGSPHGGVFLDISYLPAGPRPAQAALDVRAVQGAGRRRHHEGPDGGRADDPLRDGRHPGRGRERRRRRCRACSRRARSPAGCTAPTGWAATRCRTCWSSGRGPGLRRRPARPSPRTMPYLDPVQVQAAAAELGAPLERADGEDPYAIQRDLQEMMQRLVGIFRIEADLDEAIVQLADLRRRWQTVRATGGRSFNPGWNLVFELDHSLTVSEAIARSARQRTESRGAHSRLDHPATDDAEWNADQQRRFPGAGRLDDRRHLSTPRDAGRAAKLARQQRPLTEEPMPDAHLRVFRGGPDEEGRFEEFDVPVEEGMVVLDALHWIQGHEAPDLAVRWNCKAAKCGSCSAEVDGRPSLTCKTRLSDFDLDEPITVEPMRTFPLIRDLVTDVSWNYEVNKTIQPFTPPEDVPQEDWRWQQQDIERVQEYRKCIECFLCQDVCHVLRNHETESPFMGPRFLVRTAGLETAPDRPGRPARIPQGRAAGSACCNITKCCTEVCPEHIKITDNAIIPLKERVVDAYYDPIQWAWRKLRGKDGDPRAGTPLPMLRGDAGTCRHGTRSGPGARLSDTLFPGLDAEASEPDGREHPPRRVHHPHRRRSARQSRDRPRSERRCTTWPARTLAMTAPSRTRRSRTTWASRPTTSPNTPASFERLSWPANSGAREVHLLLDSKLIVEQLAGRWRVKDAKLIPLWSACRATLATSSAGRPCTFRAP